MPEAFVQVLLANMVRDLQAVEPGVRREALQQPGLELFVFQCDPVPLVAALRQALHDSDGQVRTRASQLLGRLGRKARPAVEDLTLLLTHSDPSTRWSAAAALAVIDRKILAAIPVLTEALVHGDDAQASQAVHALGWIGPPAASAAPYLVAKLVGFFGNSVTRTLLQLGPAAIPPLVQALSDPEEERRTKAARALGCFGPQAAEAAPRLVELLRDPASNVRIQAAIALARIGQSSEAALPILLQAFHEPGLRNLDLAEGLGRIGRPALPALLKLASRGSGEARLDAIRALGAMGPAAASAVPMLRQIVQPRPSFSQRLRLWLRLGNHPAPAASNVKHDVLRIAALMALIKTGEGRRNVANLLAELLVDPHPIIRRHAAGALGQFRVGLPDIKWSLLNVLGDPDNRVRLLAAESLATLSESLYAAIPVLLEALADQHDGDRRAEAASYLARCGPSAASASPPLLRALQDIDARVRLHAAEAVWRIDGQAEAAVPVLISLLQGEGGFTTQFLDDGMGGFECVERLSVSAHDLAIQSAAARILGEIGASAAVPALTEALEDPEPIACEAAAALQKIRVP